jgi:hypothetical protein
VADTVPVSPGFEPVDDAVCDLGKNGEPPFAEVIAAAAQRLNRLQYRGRSLYHWWAGDPISDSDDVLRTAWNNYHKPGRQLRAHLLIRRRNGAPVDGQAIRVTTDLGTYDYPSGEADLSGGSAPSDPHDLEPFEIGSGIEEAAQGPRNVSIGSRTANGPTLNSGCLFEAAQPYIDPASSEGYIPLDWIAPNSGIVAASVSGTTRNMNRIRLQLLHAWNRMRPSIAWSISKPGTNYIEFSTSAQAYRYIFDQTYGDGGSPLAVNGPGMTFPLYKSAAGVQLTVYVGCAVYAAMSATGCTGKIGLSSNTSAFSDVITGISGTAFAWYPTFAVNGESRALLAATVDGPLRVHLAAKSDTAAKYVRIGAFALYPIPSIVIA